MVINKKPTAGIVLAAGMSRRFGATKQLFDLDGSPILARVLDATLRSRLDKIYLVLGHDNHKIQKALKNNLNDHRLEIIATDDYREGMSRSLHAGLAKVKNEFQSVMFLLGDQPLLTTKVINDLLENFWASKLDICVPVCLGKQRNPTIFSHRAYSDLLKIKGDMGARQFIAEHHDQVLRVEIKNPLFFEDVDTKEDLNSIREKIYLAPTDIIDSDHESIIRYARQVVGTKGGDEVAVAVKLYYAVRDGIWYDPYVPFYRSEFYVASNVLKKLRGYCVSKASLLCALGRACAIPTRVGFANVRNHLATRELLEFMGTDIFAYHGFSELFLNGKWVKATPAFNIELCQKHGVAPLEFDGQSDSIFQLADLKGNKFMEYLHMGSTYADIPVEIIVNGWKEIYGEDRVLGWIELYEKAGEQSFRDFYKEEII